VEQLPKYIYKPVMEKIEEVYLENAKTEFKSAVDLSLNVRLVVEADSEEDSKSARVGITDIRMWELESTEE
jgi:hypothetical protein